MRSGQTESKVHNRDNDNTRQIKGQCACVCVCVQRGTRYNSDDKMSIANVVRLVREFFGQHTMSTEQAAITAETNNYNSGGDGDSSAGDSTSGGHNDDDVQQSAFSTIVEFGLKDNVSAMKYVYNSLSTIVLLVRVCVAFFATYLQRAHFVCVYVERAARMCATDVVQQKRGKQTKAIIVLTLRNELSA